MKILVKGVDIHLGQKYKGFQKKILLTVFKKKIPLFRLVTHWHTWAVAGLFSLALYLGIWPVVYHLIILPKAVPGKHGLQVNVFDRLELKGKPSHSFFNTANKLTLEKPDTSLVAYGLWEVPQTGHYRIHLECDDFGSLNLDGQDLIQLSGINARNIGEIEVELKEGYHLMVLRLFNRPGQGWLTLNTISLQKSYSLLSRASLVYLELANLNTWLRFVKGLEKGCLLLGTFSLGVLILLAFIHSDRSRKEIYYQGRFFPFMTIHPEKKRPSGEMKIFITAFFLIIFIFLSLYYQYHLYQQTIPRQKLRYFRDPVTLFEQRLLEIKPFIPSRGTIGFFSDREDSADFFQTQYSLAPLLVTKDSDSNPVIGVIYDPDFFQNPDSLKKWRIIRDFRNGLVLMERATK